MRANTPEDFEAPFEAFEAKYEADGEPLVTALIGIEDRGGDAQAARVALLDLLDAEDGPAVIEYGRSHDTDGAQTLLVMAYWRDADAFTRWRAGDAVLGWLADMQDALVGRFIESFEVRPRALDTLIAHPEVHWGLANLADAVEVTPYHAYWGATRDRILISAEDALLNAEGEALPEPASRPKGLGQIVDVVLPENAVCTRGGPDWSACQTDELTEFRNKVYPAYIAGGRYLATESQGSGCYAAYCVQATDRDGNDLQRNHQIAYFVQLSDLERWTKDHPTHRRIYGNFMAMLGKLGRMPDVNLYHEVSIAAKNAMHATYANCLPETGLLRFGTPRG